MRYTERVVCGELFEAVEIVRARIEAFRGDLQKSEALTRYALVDPILRALGWDTADPKQVRPEFPTETGSPDYALLHDRRPLIMVEAKALDKSLAAARDKGFQYCWKNKVSYYVITDGNTWEVYDLREMGGKTILKITLTEGVPGDLTRSLLALWRPAMPAVAVPMPPLAQPELKEPPAASLPQTTLSLVELHQKMRKREIPRNSPPPQKVIFPDGTEKPTKSWKGLFLAVVEWSKDWLTDKLPLTRPSTGRVIVAREASGMRAPKAVGPYWVETQAGSLYLVKSALLALERAGQDPSRVWVALR